MRTALITGANRGLGLEVSRQLHEQGFAVWMAGRDEPAVQAAAASVGARAHPLTLDVADERSIADVASRLAAEAPLHALVNNAGTTFSGLDARVAMDTLRTNTWGPLKLTEALTAQLANDANVVMVSSGMGELRAFSPSLRQRLLAKDLSLEDVEDIGREFVAAVTSGSAPRAGFPHNAYSVSKALLNALTRVVARQWGGRGLKINAVCPGWVRTRMGGAGATRSVSKGASGIVWAATLEAGGPTGGFFRDGNAIDW